MPAPTTLSELIALYLARCRIEGLSPRTQRAYSETLARFQRSVAAQGLPDAAAAVETATVIRYCESFQARRPATRQRYFRAVRCFFNWCVAAGFLDQRRSAACATSGSRPSSSRPSAPPSSRAWWRRAIPPPPSGGAMPPWCCSSSTPASAAPS